LKGTKGANIGGEGEGEGEKGRDQEGAGTDRARGGSKEKRGGVRGWKSWRGRRIEGKERGSSGGREVTKGRGSRRTRCRERDARREERAEIGGRGGSERERRGGRKD